MTQVTVGGQPGYQIRSFNLFDVFDFDFQAGCSDGGDRKANCRRFNSKMNIGLAGGDDNFSLGLVPNGTSSVAAGSGNDRVSGHPGADNLNGGTGDDDMIGMGGADTVKGRDGADKLRGGSGNDTVNGENGQRHARRRRRSRPTARRSRRGHPQRRRGERHDPVEGARHRPRLRQGHGHVRHGPGLRRSPTSRTRSAPPRTPAAELARRSTAARSARPHM